MVGSAGAGVLMARMAVEEYMAVRETIARLCTDACQCRPACAATETAGLCERRPVAFKCLQGMRMPFEDCLPSLTARLPACHADSV